MSNLFSETLHSIRDGLLKKEADKRLRLKNQHFVRDTIESVVNTVDPKLRVVSGYRDKLWGPVVGALQYIHDLVEQIEGAIYVSSRTFGNDPYVNAFFANKHEIQRVFSNKELHEFFSTCEIREAGECYALLCMHKKERQVLGIAMEGGMMKREVPQTTVSFSDHQVLFPAFTEAEAKEGLKHCLLDGLIANAGTRIHGLKERVEELLEQEHILQTRLRSLQAKERRLQSLGRFDAEVERDIETARSKLDASRQQLAGARRQAFTEQDYLRQLVAILACPQDYVALTNTTLKLNKLGVKMALDSKQAGNLLHLSEVRFGQQAPRVIVLVRYPRDELAPVKTFLESTSHLYHYDRSRGSGTVTG